MHKFYLNQPVWGVLYLIFCWTFIPLVISLVEALCYLSESQQTFQARYG